MVADHVINKPRSVPPVLAVDKIDNAHVGEFQWIDVRCLFVPEEYQRTLIEDHTRDIAREFDWYNFGGTLVVSDRHDGRYAIVDGQNRWNAARIRGVAAVPCMVHTFPSVEAEAVAFDRLNGRRRPVGTWCRQKSELFQKNPIALAADEFISEIGSKAVPIATLRNMARYFTVELRRLTPLIKELLLVGGTPLRADFLEAICVLEAMLGETSSLTVRWRSRIVGSGYQDCIEGMEVYRIRIGRYPHGRRGWQMKANALLYGLNTRVNATFEPNSPNRRPHRQRRSVMVRGDYWDDEAAPLAAE